MAIMRTFICVIFSHFPFVLLVFSYWIKWLGYLPTTSMNQKSDIDTWKAHRDIRFWRKIFKSSNFPNPLFERVLHQWIIFSQGPYSEIIPYGNMQLSYCRETIGDCSASYNWDWDIAWYQDQWTGLGAGCIFNLPLDTVVSGELGRSCHECRLLVVTWVSWSSSASQKWLISAAAR